MQWTIGWLSMRRFSLRMSSEFCEAPVATSADFCVVTKMTRNRRVKPLTRKGQLVVVAVMEKTMRVGRMAMVRVEVAVEEDPQEVEGAVAGLCLSSLTRL